MSHWVDYNFEKRIRNILRMVKYHKASHHLGRPFLSAYQIAIEFDRLHPEVRRTMDHEIGGKGVGAHNSFSQYIAKGLSQNIKRGTISDIEGGFISNEHLADLTFKCKNKVIKSSLTGTGFDLSIFRYNPNNGNQH